MPESTGSESARQLRRTHTPEAIRSRLSGRMRHSYLSDFIYGGIDGAVTTFAVVSGVAGAGLEPTIIIILGGANLIGDGFSMAAANFLGVRADRQQLVRMREIERREIELNPEGEREEVRQIFAGMGVTGETLENVVRAITSDRERWVDVMITEEHGLARELRSPVRAASATLAAFIVVGAIPLIPFVAHLVGLEPRGPYAISTALVAIAFFLVGAMKCRFVTQRWWVGGLETLTVGGLAAALAYLVGWFLGQVA